MTEANDPIQQYRRALRNVLAILAELDPMGIADQGNPDRENEYDPEAASIVRRLFREARSEKDCRRIANEEFQRWFGVKAIDRGAARRIWSGYVEAIAETPADGSGSSSY